MPIDWITSLPESLQNAGDLEKLKMCVTQWSRLVSWVWSPILAFKDDENMATQERILKTFFNKTLQKQGQYTYAYESYAVSTSKEEADELSLVLKHLLLGEYNSITDSWFSSIKGVGVTLSDVLKKLSGEDFVLTKYPDFAAMFTFRIIVNYTGTITEIGTRKYIARLAYPPRPVLSESTVTEQQLNEWVTNINTGGEYLPPSVYIPIAST
jgi:hypothetical protein